METHFEHEYFTVNDVYERLKQNRILQNALKLIFISACRGDIRDDIIQSMRNANVVESKNVVPSQTIEQGTDTNINAVRVTAEPNRENFITMFASVEGTVALDSNEGSFIGESFCACLNSLEKDVSIVEFLTRIMFCIDRELNRFYGYGETPEVKIFKHRELTITKKVAESYDPVHLTLSNVNYDWISDKMKHILKRKAHFYISYQSKDGLNVSNLQDLLRSNFGLQVKQHDCLKTLALSISAKSEEEDGCVFIFIVAQLRTEEKTGEIFAKIDDEFIPIKRILYTSIGPNTGNWIGKPKLFVFLNSSEASTSRDNYYDVCQVYKESDFTRSGTIHAGLLSLILPQQNAVKFFNGELEEYTKSGKMRTSTFQQFFTDVQRKAINTFEIKPMVISTLEMMLGMSFPCQTVAKNFILTGVYNNVRVLRSALSNMYIGFLRGSARAAHSRPEIMAIECMLADSDQAHVGRVEKSIVELKCEYTVFIISAHAGWGASALTQILTSRASEEERKITNVNLSNDNEFYKALNYCNKDYKALFQQYWQLKGQPRPFGGNELIVLDNLDGLRSAELESMLKMVRQMAKDRVCLMISMWPKSEEIVEKSLQGICPVTIVHINHASRENQIALLESRIGGCVQRDAIESILEEIERAGAGDLTEKIGSLEHLATFPNLTGQESVNIYALSKHVFNLTVEMVLHRVIGLTPMSGKYQKYRKEHTKQLSILSQSYFCDTPVKNDIETNLEHYGIVRVLKSRVDVLSKTLAAYLCLSEGLISLKQIRKMPHEKRKILESMWNDKEQLNEESD
ncbi:Hypothetical predicted protein [Cloeon dipterum]|nr:Hypothetical predicted protein [Cloeon dipterum]